MDLRSFAAVLLAGVLAGSELTSWGVVHPTLWKLDHRQQVHAEKLMYRRFAAIDPILMTATIVACFTAAAGLRSDGYRPLIDITEDFHHATPKSCPTSQTRSKTRGSMRADFLLEPEGLHIEYDEIQHFTTARLTTLDLYPEDTVVAFSPADYRATVEMWRSKGDKAFAHKEAAEFPGRLGRQRQRAYLDAFRDLVGSYFGNRPVVRIAAPDNDYRDAVARLGRLVARR